MKYVGLMDCNNFFVSCERLFRPDLRTVPTMVLSSNDGCVVARSQEIKDIGIPMGVPYFKIKDSLKNIEYATFSSNFTLYRDISTRVFSVMCEHLDSVEKYSIDEAFFTLEADTAAELEQALHSLRDDVMRKVGIPVSIGLARTKTQAKFAASLAKKTAGVRTVENDEFAALAVDIPLYNIWGVGRGRERQFSAVGLKTVNDFIKLDQERVSSLFGVEGTRLFMELKGMATGRAVRDIPQSIMSSRSFRTPTSDINVIEDALAYHVQNVMEIVREKGFRISTLRVQVSASRYGDYFMRGGSLDTDFVQPTKDSLEVLSAANKLLSTLFEAEVQFTKTGVAVSGLVPEDLEQSSLFSDNDTDDSLMQIIDGINATSTKELVRIGSHLRENEWKPKTNKLSPGYTTRWTDIASVKA